MIDNKSGEIFSLELSVGTFIGAIIATFIYFLDSQQDIKSLISIALTFSFPIYLLKLSRNYEKVNCNKRDFAKLILFQDLTKTGLKNYLKNICSYVFCIIFFILLALLYNMGLEHFHNIFGKIFFCYGVLTLLIASSYILMEIIFGFFIGTFVLAEKFFNRSD